MIKIQHRVNDLNLISTLPKSMGAEIDIRYHNNDLILEHDPFNHHKNSNLVKFEEFLNIWDKLGPLILNIKTEGIESHCLDLMAKYNVDNWFFLDLSMPYFVKYSLLANSKKNSNFTPKNLAVRYSIYEPIEYALSFADKAQWVWCDCFDGRPIDFNKYLELKKAGFSICIVSPELQQYPSKLISDFQQTFKKYKIDAVCTKYPELWS